MLPSSTDEAEYMQVLKYVAPRATRCPVCPARCHQQVMGQTKAQSKSASFFPHSAGELQLRRVPGMCSESSHICLAES